MTGPERIPDPADLDRMGVEELFDAFLAFRRVGDTGSAKLCIQLFAFQMRPQLLGRAIRKCSPDVAELVVDATIESVLKDTEPEDDIPFRGDKRAQLHKWVYTILKHRIADHYRTTERREAIAQIESLDAPAGGEGASHGETFPDEEDGFVEIELREIREGVLAEMNPDHRRVIELWLQGYDSTEVAGMTGTTANNVDQIRSRYRKAYRQALEDAGVGQD